MRKQLIISIIGLCFITSLFAQYDAKAQKHALTFKPEYFQVKDQLNYGLVHNGLNLAGEYQYLIETSNRFLSYSSEIGFGINYRQGLGLFWTFKPIDLFYGFKLGNNPTSKIIVGPYYASIYSWQLYPELKSGHMSWNTSYELGPKIIASFPYRKKSIKISFSNSIAGFSSRPELKTEEYFYSLTLSDYAKNAHKNLNFGSMDVNNHVNLEVELITPDKNRSISYEFEYISVLTTSSFSYISHAINLNWTLGNKKSKQ